MWFGTARTGLAWLGTSRHGQEGGARLRPRLLLMSDSIAPLVALFIEGRPVPAGSKKAFGKAIVDVSGENLVDWKYRIRKAAEGAMDGAPPVPRVFPIEIHVRFYMKRPMTHFHTGRKAGRLKPNVPNYPVGKPDTTKLLRAVEDALSGILWEDDAQVIVQRCAKVYGEDGKQGVEVRAWRR